MKIRRGLAAPALHLIDQIVPPIVRDSRWFMYLPMRMILKEATGDYLTFKNWIFARSDKEIEALYERTAHVGDLQGETDLNDACLQEILSLVRGRRVLEVGCGRGLLAGRLAAENEVTACDIVIRDGLAERYPSVHFRPANVERLPFDDNSYDVVVSTHTLEHVTHISDAIGELRRVARDELIIVVPRQRPYKYTFSLHTHFFPYEWSLHAAFGCPERVAIRNVDGDWLYHQTKPSTDC